MTTPESAATRGWWIAEEEGKIAAFPCALPWFYCHTCNRAIWSRVLIFTVGDLLTSIALHRNEFHFEQSLAIPPAKGSTVDFSTSTMDERLDAAFGPPPAGQGWMPGFNMPTPRKRDDDVK